MLECRSETVVAAVRKTTTFNNASQISETFNTASTFPGSHFTSASTIISEPAPAPHGSCSTSTVIFTVPIPISKRQDRQQIDVMHSQFLHITSSKLAKGAPSLRHMVLLSNALTQSPQDSETQLEDEFDGESQKRAEEEWLDGVLEEMIMQEEVEDEEEEETGCCSNGESSGEGSAGGGGHGIASDYVNVSFRHHPQYPYQPRLHPYRHSEHVNITDSGYLEGDSSDPAESDNRYLDLRAEMSSSFLVLNTEHAKLPPLPESPPPEEEDVPSLGFSPPDCTFKPGHTKWKRSVAESDWESSNDSLPEIDDEESIKLSASPTIFDSFTERNTNRDRTLPFRGVEVYDDEQCLDMDEEEERGRSRGCDRMYWKPPQPQPSKNVLNVHPATAVQIAPWKFTPPTTSTPPPPSPSSYYNTFNVLHFHPFVPPVLMSSTGGPTRKSVSASRSPFTPVPPAPPPPPVQYQRASPLFRLQMRPPPPLAPPPPPPAIPVWATRMNKRDGLVKVCKSEVGENGEVDIVEDQKKVDKGHVRSFYDCTDLGEARGWFMRG
ncbi:hypothetical protein BT69DRAFT_1324266 [Atractiella rhizophila]|nr:hypothetical protein BT69DRAFT_1324266 [Atractiella rhizophila]